MFASLKNKIREETGSDISKLTAKLASSTTQKFESLRGRGSSSSVNSLISSDGAKDEGCDALKTDDELKKKNAKFELELSKKFEEKQKEWKESSLEKDKKVQNLEKEKYEAYKQISKLKEALKLAEDFKNKILQQKENKEQVECFQSQELVKIKNLILQRDQELADKNQIIKDLSQQLDKLKNEIGRLRRQEERLSDIQDDLESLRHSSARDMAALATELAKSEEDRRYLTDLVSILRQRLSEEEEDNDGESNGLQERKLLEQRLEEVHLHLADIKTSWSDKIASLETQVGRLNRQAAEEAAERRRAIKEKEALEEKVKQLECELECNCLELNNKESKVLRLTEEIEELANEVKHLRAESEEEITFLRQKLQDAETEVKAVRKNLDNSESQLEKTEEERSKLKISVDSEHQTNVTLRQIITKLEKELNEEKSNSLDVQKTLSRVTAEKNAALLRNAEISQQIDLAKQEARRKGLELNELSNKVAQLDAENQKYKELESKNIEQELRNSITRLEEQLIEKNKNIKTLQLRLLDMKKALQQELRAPSKDPFTDYSDSNSVAILAPSQNLTRNYHNSLRKDEDDINFKYLKHVVIKFLTSREYEAIHLIRAIATLLKFSPEEEKLIQDTLEWKMSWFGKSRPSIGNGQLAKAIPPS
ncbi:golgin subfamily A member 1-like [Agrilus planipennis]|uniref:Golgin subfamily A member 1 n=1 Tax=Agrilus planipennis TaxID=224129 RepID=A0A7F5R6U9_AGRPL|nr:golgin subfamily A member 1-like [Agrilus planipennis]